MRLQIFIVRARGKEGPFVPGIAIDIRWRSSKFDGRLA